MPVVLPPSMCAMAERFDCLPWAVNDFSDCSQLPLPLPLDADCMSFDHISKVLSRCATPPPESLPPSPLDSAVTSPCESRSPSPIADLFFDNFDMMMAFDDSATASAVSTPFSSSPSSPMSSGDTFAAFAAPGVKCHLSFEDAAPINSVAALKQARRALRTGGILAKPMKVKRIAKGSSSSSSISPVTIVSAAPAPACMATPFAPSSSSFSDLPALYSAADLAASSSFSAFPFPCSSPSPSAGSSSAGSKLPVCKRSKAVAMASKRDSHNISERNRRQELKMSFTTLQNMVPNLINAVRAHTGTVLKETIAYIHALQQEEDRLMAAKAAALQQRAMILSM